MIGGWGILGEIALRWLPQDLIDDESALVQVMAWCCQANGDPDLCRHMASLGCNELKIMARKPQFALFYEVKNYATI